MQARAPALFCFAKYLIRNNVRGGWRLLLFLRDTGALPDVSYPLGGDVQVKVPLARMLLSEAEVQGYEADFVQATAAVVNRWPASVIVTLIDAGADIGLFSLKMKAACPAIQEVLAFEPNSEGFKWLQANLLAISHDFVAHNCAVADYIGRGRLVCPNGGDYAEQYLEQDPAGDIMVSTIDSFALLDRPCVLLKLDVEGGELAALRGAQRTIERAGRVVVAIEANPWVVRRTGTDTVECLRQLSALRAFSFQVSETGRKLDLTEPVFAQIAPTRVYNVLAVSQETGSP